MMIRLKARQGKVFRSEQRFRILVAGRRFGRTYLALTELIRGAWGPGRIAWYVCPTYRQAKRVAWKPLKSMTKEYWAKLPNETDLTIELTSGGIISLRGADNYELLRGDGLDFIVLDEFASMAPEAWGEVLRPALADKQGRALFIGTPHGHNHFFDLYEAAQERPNWETFQYTTEQGGTQFPRGSRLDTVRVEMGFPKERELEIAKEVDRLSLLDRLDSDATPEILAMLGFRMDSTDQEFLKCYIEWRIANPVVK